MNIFKTIGFKKIATVAVFLVFFGFGCKGLSAEEKQAVSPVVLNYWTVYNNLEQLEKFAQEYKKIRPYVTVSIRQVRYDEFDRLFTNALADDVGPDIVSMNVRWLGKYRTRLGIMPSQVQVSRLQLKSKLNKEIEVIQETNTMPSVKSIRSAYVQSVGADAIRSGDVYGLPLALDALAIYYNKDLLDKAGIPEPPATWDEFVEAVKKSTKFSSSGSIIQSGVALGTSANIDNTFDILSLLMLQNGVQMASNNSVTFATDIDKIRLNHPTMQALRFYADFANPNKEAYSWNDSMDDAFTSFVRGKNVFYFGYAFDRSRILSRAPGMNLSVIPMPQLNPASPVNVANYWLESVSKKTAHADEAWDFVRYITSPEKVKEYTDASLQPSPIRAQITAQQENEDLAPFASQVLFAQNWYNGRDVDEADKAFKDLVTLYNRPYEDEKDPVKRDVDLILNTARVVQQTM
ncbi:MAG: extracellular solute-binding protein [Candidatus Magasanikbacteria bacterium]|nr:extracellular solute-binding protein [Candidatus Magasanikbacteria bacterium]